MNTSNLARMSETDATRGDLRPSELRPRPIRSPEQGPTTPIGGRR
jgi:hypothetical protein